MDPCCNVLMLCNLIDSFWFMNGQRKTNEEELNSICVCVFLFLLSCFMRGDVIGQQFDLNQGQLRT